MGRRRYGSRLLFIHCGRRLTGIIMNIRIFIQRSCQLLARSVGDRAEFVLVNDNNAGDRFLDHVDNRCSTGISATCLGAFRGAATVFGGGFFLAAGFVALMPARRTLDFALFGVARPAVFLRAGLALALPRFELFLRAATRFFALAMAVSCEVCRLSSRPCVYVFQLSEFDNHMERAACT
jgi:hypothetical protein